MKVREVIARLEADGWYQVRTKAGLVTVAGKLSLDVPIGTLKSIWKQAQLED